MKAGSIPAFLWQGLWATYLNLDFKSYEFHRDRF